MSILPLKSKRPGLLTLLFVLLPLSWSSSAARAQQDYVGRYDIYNGYAALIAPKLDLTTRGYHFQGGWNQKTWLAE